VQASRQHAAVARTASEAPEFIVAIIFASRGKGVEAIATPIPSKVNQRTLLVGSLPIAQLVGGGTGVLTLDAQQVEEMYLTATQTLMGVALIPALRFHRAAALALLGLFAIQFPLTGESSPPDPVRDLRRLGLHRLRRQPRPPVAHPPGAFHWNAGHRAARHRAGRNTRSTRPSVTRSR
jgi:hypothetical protein